MLDFLQIIFIDKSLVIAIFQDKSSKRLIYLTHYHRHNIILKTQLHNSKTTGLNFDLDKSSNSWTF